MSRPQSFELEDVEANTTLIVQPHQRWHPKITPYRLLVLVTTIAICSGKAISSQSGNNFISTTLEWIFGTVLSLFFFSVSSYDSESASSEIPQYLSWLFSPDCMNLFWRFLGIFHIPRPPYTSRERRVRHTSPDFPLVTWYRILVCVIVTSFGCWKAILGYFGSSAEVNWVDWTFAVPVTTIIYCLGLYEYNTSRMWSSFFAVERSDELRYVNKGVMYTLLACLASLCIAMFLHFFASVGRGLIQDFTDLPTEGTVLSTMKTHILNYSVFFLSAQLLFLYLLLGVIVFSILALYWSVVRAARSIFHPIRSQLHVIRKIISRAFLFRVIFARLFTPFRLDSYPASKRYIRFLFRACYDTLGLSFVLLLLIPIPGTALGIAMMCFEWGVGIPILGLALFPGLVLGLYSIILGIFSSVGFLTAILVTLAVAVCLLTYATLAIFILLIVPWSRNADAFYAMLQPAF